MDAIYKNYLFNKHYLVSDVDVAEDENTAATAGTGASSAAPAATGVNAGLAASSAAPAATGVNAGLAASSAAPAADTAETTFQTLFALANLFNIRITEGAELVRSEMISYAADRLGENVPEPFYKGFPESVRKLSSDELLFDQMVHYSVTYGFGNFSEAGHSIMEEYFERSAFKEKAEIKDFKIITEEAAVGMLAEMVDNLLAGTRPLSLEQYTLVKSFVISYDHKVKSVASKNTCVKLLMDTRDLRFTGFLALSDVIKLVDEMNYALYRNERINKLNLRNQDRKFITSVINAIFAAGNCDIRTCFEKKKAWNGLLHHLHFSAENEEQQAFLDAMRGRTNDSVYSEFERAMAAEDIRSAVDALRKGKGSGAILRNLNYIISRCTTTEELEYVLGSIDTRNAIILLQLLVTYADYAGQAARRTFAFTKFDRLRVYTESDKDMKKRRSMITVGQAKDLERRIRENLQKVLSGRLGKVYIDPEMVNYALPLQETTSQGGFGVLTRGSRIHIGETKKLRAFTYWEKVNDIDLSVFGIDTDGRQTEFSWRTMAGRQSEAITYSGDETSGYNGGSEYFDIDTEAFRKQYPKIRYLIFCDNVYSALPFSRVYCRAGYMLRDLEDSGQVFEPKTVKSSFVVNCDSTFEYLFGIDLETNDFIWLNMARDSHAQVAGTTDMSFMTDYFHVTDIINVKTFFEMMATEVVDNMADADVIVTNKEVAGVPGGTSGSAGGNSAGGVNAADSASGGLNGTVEGTEAAAQSAGGRNTADGRNEAEIIREYDIEKMIALMNIK